MDLYFKKKEQLSNSVNKIHVVDSQVELDKKRSQSPAPRSLSVVPPSRGKVVYKSDHDELTKKIDDLKKIVESLESSKTENLKNAVNDCIKKTNDNIASISNEMVRHLDILNELKSRMDAIEAVL